MLFLIVDDDEAFRMLCTHKLAPHGECAVACNGAQAVEIFTDHLAAGTPFRAVFMDIQMPGLDGHTVVDLLRKIEQAHKVTATQAFKLIMVTAQTDTKNVCESFFHGGADAYVPKPEIKTRLIPELKRIKLIE